MKKFNLIILSILSISLLVSLYRLNDQNRMIEELNFQQQINQSMIDKQFSNINELTFINDSLITKLNDVENKLAKATLKVNTKLSTKTKQRRYSKLNQYSRKSLPSELEIDSDGWITFCGTKYNPEPSQCFGDCTKTATGKSVYDLINDPYHLGMAITKIGLQYFNMHDTVEIQYMDVEGNWITLKAKDGKEILGLIEDRMSPKLNKYYCLDILTSREQMDELPFCGLAKCRIRKK